MQITNSNRRNNLSQRTSQLAAVAMLIVFFPTISAAQTETVLHRFGWQSESSPMAPLIRDADGNLYGTTYGSLSVCCYSGSIFEMSPSGAEKVLHIFTGGGDGSFIKGGLVRDNQGNLYGSAYYGGASGDGLIFELSDSGAFQVLYSFTGGDDGAIPNSTLVRDDQGNLYGTTVFGPTTSSTCSFGCGEVFELSSAGVLTVLHNFIGGTDGWGPSGGLLRDSQGSLYGTTTFGGGTTCDFGSGCGAVFAISSSGTFTVLHDFAGGADGANPQAGLVEDADGILYGTTSGYDGSSGPGTVFQISKAGDESVLYTFGENAAYPMGGVVRDAQGNLYGTTMIGGSGSCAGRCGVVFKLAPSGTETILHNFAGGTDGWLPEAGLVRDAKGNLYGTTTFGGLEITNCSGGCGTVFKVTP